MGSVVEEQPFKGMSVAPKLDELVTAAFKRAAKSSVKKHGKCVKDLRKIYEKKIRIIRDYTVKRLQDICFTTPKITELHPFYREWVKLIVDVDELRRELGHLYTVSKLVNKIAGQELRRLRSTSRPSEARRVYKSFVGRFFSLMKTIEETLLNVREKQLKLVKLQSINPLKPTVVIAGPPNVGKSSLVRALSKAKPEVREYPFTTKELTIGHIKLNNHIVQVIDTPGLLDRPLEERNPIELKAILALKHLASIIVFVLDPTETCGFPLEYQLHVLDDVLKNFKNIPIIVALNKNDIVDKNQLEKFLEHLSKRSIVDAAKISALKREGIDVLMDKIMKNLHLGAIS